MLYIFISILIIIPSLSGIGGIAERIVRAENGGFSGKLLLGVLVSSMVFTSLSFFIPITWQIELLTLTIGWLGFLYLKIYKQGFSIIKEDYKSLLLCTLLIICLSSFYPFILDHFGYYVPSILWIKEYGLVQGISNLDLTLGQMSIWHIFQAGFSHFSDIYLRINAVILVVYLFYIFENRRWVHLCFVPILCLFSQSPSPDLPVLAFSMILLSEILSKNKNFGVLFAFSVFVFTIKPTMIWLPLFVFLYTFSNLKRLGFFLIPSSMIFLIFCAKNLITFGFPIFPVQVLDFNLPWKPNAELLKNSSKIAILKTYDMQYSYEEIKNFTTMESVKNWFFLNGIKSKIHILFALLLIVFTIYTFIKKNKILYFLLFSVLVKSILVLAFSAQYRFFSDVFLVVFFVLFHRFFGKKISLAVFGFSGIVIGFCLSFPSVIQTHIPSFRLGHYIKGFTARQLYKPATYKSNKVLKFQLGNMEFYTPRGYSFAYDYPLPSASIYTLWELYEAKIFPQKNSSHLGQGLHYKKLSSRELEQLKTIIETIEREHKKNTPQIK